MFAVQNGGWCASSALAAKTFNKYGKSSVCPSDGGGGPWANQVYYIKGGYTATITLIMRPYTKHDGDGNEKVEKQKI